MAQPNFQCTIEVNASPRKCFDAIKKVSGWWATNVTGNAERIDDIFTIRFGKTFSTMKVTDNVPYQKISWLVLDSKVPLFKDVTQWNNTILVFDLVKTGDGTKVTFTHVGLTPETECYSDCEKGWNFYIKESLSNLIRQGIGLPGTGIFGNLLLGDRKYEGLIFYKNDPLPDFPEGSVIIDVRETRGEHVISAYSIGNFDKKTFDAKSLKGDYYMLVNDDRIINNLLELEESLTVK